MPSSFFKDHWITPSRRLAIYLRDGLACVYCNIGVEAGADLTLDHLRPKSAKGRDVKSNLVTACRCCNSSRKDRDWVEFATSKGEGVVEFIEKTRWKTWNIPKAKKILAERRTVLNALVVLRPVA